MGCAVAAAAVKAGHEVTMLGGRVSIPLGGDAPRVPPRCELVPFEGIRELAEELASRFASCDALVMAAAVGDFRAEISAAGKLHRSGGPVDVRLVPTEDVLAGVAVNKRPKQIVVAFSVEDGPENFIEQKARGEMQAKNADYVVVNTPAAMAAPESRACILSPSGMELPWARRPKDELAERIVAILSKART